MSLFVGNISRQATEADLLDLFSKHGPCKIDLKTSFAFLEFESEEDAGRALAAVHGAKVMGLYINVEWSKKSCHFDSDRRELHRRREDWYPTLFGPRNFKRDGAVDHQDANWPRWNTHSPNRALPEADSRLHPRLDNQEPFFRLPDGNDDCRTRGRPPGRYRPAGLDRPGVDRLAPRHDRIAWIPVPIDRAYANSAICSPQASHYGTLVEPLVNEARPGYRSSQEVLQSSAHLVLAGSTSPRQPDASSRRRNNVHECQSSYWPYRLRTGYTAGDARQSRHHELSRHHRAVGHPYETRRIRDFDCCVHHRNCSRCQESRDLAFGDWHEYDTSPSSTRFSGMPRATHSNHRFREHSPSSDLKRPSWPPRFYPVEQGHAPYHGTCCDPLVDKGSPFSVFRYRTPEGYRDNRLLRRAQLPWSSRTRGRPPSEYAPQQPPNICDPTTPPASMASGPGSSPLKNASPGMAQRSHYSCAVAGSIKRDSQSPLSGRRRMSVGMGGRSSPELPHIQGDSCQALNQDAFTAPTGYSGRLK